MADARKVQELSEKMNACMERFKTREDYVSRDENNQEKGRVRFFDLRGVTEDKFSESEKESITEAMQVLRERKQKGVQPMPRVIKITPQNMERFLKQSRSQYKVIENMPTKVLNNGESIPLIGLGTWKSKPGQIKDATLHAVRAGYRHIDCAEYYANEHEIGQALQIVFMDGVVKREDLFLTSKLWNNHHSKASVRPAVEKILRDLKVQYLDLLLIHWPVVTGNVGPTLEPTIKETWQAMEELVSEGLVRSIGVSNFSSKKMDGILTYAKITPAVLQVEVHPYWRQDGLLKYCQEKGIHMTAFSPLGSPDSSSMFRRTGPKLMDDPTLTSIAAKLNRSPAQCLIRWGLQHGTSLLPKSVNQGRIQANLDVLNWDLPEQDYQALCNLGNQERMVGCHYFLNPKGPYKTSKDFWDE
jgi:diketogulonate reductase-like aldo/keto reductase